MVKFSFLLVLLFPLFSLADNEITHHDLKNTFIKTLYPDVEFRNNNKLCIVPEKGSYTSRVFTECDVLIQHLIVQVVDQGRLSGDGFSFLTKSAYNSFLKYYLSFLEVVSAGDSSELNQVTLARFLYVLLEIDKVAKDNDLLTQIDHSISSNIAVFDKIFKNLGNEEFVSRLGSSLITFYEKLPTYNSESVIFFQKLVLTYGSNEQFEKILFSNFNNKNSNLVTGLKTLKTYLDENSLKTSNESAVLLEKLIFCATDFINSEYNNRCKFLETYPVSILENFTALYLEYGSSLVDKLSFQKSLGFLNQIPEYYMTTETFSLFRKTVLPSLFKPQNLTEEQKMQLCIFIKNENQCRAEFIANQNKQNNFNILKYIFIFLSVLTVFGYLAYRYYNKLKSVKSSSRIEEESCLTSEERSELRELRSYFMLRPNSNFAELARNYRKKVKTIHPDTSKGDNQEFLTLQTKYTRIRLLLTRLNEEKENRLSKAESFFRY